MASYLLAATLALLSARLVASQDQEVIWGSVVMTMHGERTPKIFARPNLTPLGAQQAISAGRAIRTRYIEGPDTNVTKNFPIRGLQVNQINNTQLYILTTDEDYMAATAQAVMQGVYPPLGQLYVDDEAILANNTMIQYPIGGYQYPTMDTISPLDFNYVS
jgi:hypothetical protein